MRRFKHSLDKGRRRVERRQKGEEVLSGIFTGKAKPDSGYNLMGNVKYNIFRGPAGGRQRKTRFQKRSFFRFPRR